MPRLTRLEDVLFPVEQYPVFVSVPDGPSERWLPVPDKKAIVNATSERVLGIVSRDYRLVRNCEALDWAHQCCGATFPETRPDEWKVKAVDAPATGGHCSIDLVHNSPVLDFSFVPAHEQRDAFCPFIRVTNSYNTLRALAFDIGFIRKVCTNGLIAPDPIIRFKFIHLHRDMRRVRRDIGEIIRFEVDHERFATLKASFLSYLGALRACAVHRTDFEPLVRSVLLLWQPEPLEPDTREAHEWNFLSTHLGELNDRYARELGENAYAVFSAITEFASHPPANRYVRRDRHSLQRLAGAWLTDFGRRCRQPGFNLPRYFETQTKPKPAMSGA